MLQLPPHWLAVFVSMTALVPVLKVQTLRLLQETTVSELSPVWSMFVDASVQAMRDLWGHGNACLVQGLRTTTALPCARMCSSV